MTKVVLKRVKREKVMNFCISIMNVSVTISIRLSTYFSDLKISEMDDWVDSDEDDDMDSDDEGPSESKDNKKKKGAINFMGLR